MVVVKTTEPRTVELLVASGVEMQTWDLPAELSEDHVGPPISHDDLLDFHDLVSDDAAFEAALEELAGITPD